MKKILILFSLILASIAWLPAQETGLQRAIRSVCTVYAYDAQGQPFSSGSAVIVSTNIAFTCYHVVAGAYKVTLRTYDGKCLYVSSYIPKEGQGDQVLLKILSKDCPPSIPYEETKSYQVGDRIYAIGNADGWEGTVSEGIISATRHAGLFWIGDVQGGIIQFTAAINPGNSGGALVNARGKLIGYVFATKKDGQNISFAKDIYDCNTSVLLAQSADKYPLGSDPQRSWWPLPFPVIKDLATLKKEIKELESIKDAQP